MGRESHGHDPTVVHSSIALLQERFRQLQRVKEMREERQLLRMLTPEPKQLISNSKPTMRTSSTVMTTHELPPTTSFSHPELTIIPSPRTPPPPYHTHVSLSLWPSPSQEPPQEKLSVATFLELEAPPVSSMNIWRKNAYDCDGSDSDSDSGVDTSLHL